ncbi:MAG: caspase family protein [Terracidiphilus sp.]
MPSRALLVGIDDYEYVTALKGCRQDAADMAALLERNDDGSRNYECRVLPNSDSPRVSRITLRKEWLRLFNNFDGHIAFYFSGHGVFSEFGGYLMTQDASQDDPGLAMYELLQLANDSSASEVLLILDCCNSGAAGNLPPQRFGMMNQAQIREGVTILAASRPTEIAVISKGRSIFTSLLLTALKGAAADIRGHVSAASIYAFVEQSLGAFDQRPLYKSYAVRLSPVRRCNPEVPDQLLRELVSFFPTPEYRFRLNKTYEHTDPSAIPEHVQVFDKFKIFRNARLLKPVEHPDLFFAAMNEGHVELTVQGKAYRGLAEDRRI